MMSSTRSTAGDSGLRMIGSSRLLGTIREELPRHTSILLAAIVRANYISFNACKELFRSIMEALSVLVLYGLSISHTFVLRPRSIIFL